MVRHDEGELARCNEESDGAVEYAFRQHDVCRPAGKYLVSLQRCRAQTRFTLRLVEAAGRQRSGDGVAGLSHDGRVAAAHESENWLDAELQHIPVSADERW